MAIQIDPIAAKLGGVPQPAPSVVPLPTEGLLTPGTITNLYDRPVLKNPDGSVSTTSSESANFDGKEVLYPTVVDGKRLSSKDAQDHYRQTGEHLGIFDTPEHADAYAQALHLDQERRMGLSAPTPDPLATKLGGLPETSLSFGGKPYLSGAFTPQELETIGQSPAAQAFAQPQGPPPPALPKLPRPEAGYDPAAAALERVRRQMGQTSNRPGETDVEGRTELGDVFPVRQGFQKLTQDMPRQVGQAVAAVAHPDLYPDTGTAVSAALFNAGSDLIEGGFDVASPLMVPAFASSPLSTVITSGLALLATHGASGATAALGGSPEAQRFIGNLAGAVTLVGVGGAELQRLVELGQTGTDAFVKKVQAKAREAVLAGRLSGGPLGRTSSVPTAAGLSGPIELGGIPLEGMGVAGPSEAATDAARAAAERTPVAPEAPPPGAPDIAEAARRIIEEENARRAGAADPIATGLGGTPTPPPAAPSAGPEAPGGAPPPAEGTPPPAPGAVEPPPVAPSGRAPKRPVAVGDWVRVAGVGADGQAVTGRYIGEAPLNAGNSIVEAANGDRYEVPTPQLTAAPEAEPPLTEGEPSAADKETTPGPHKFSDAPNHPVTFDEYADFYHHTTRNDALIARLEVPNKKLSKKDQDSLTRAREDRDQNTTDAKVNWLIDQHYSPLLEGFQQQGVENLSDADLDRYRLAAEARERLEGRAGARRYFADDSLPEQIGDEEARRSRAYYANQPKIRLDHPIPKKGVVFEHEGKTYAALEGGVSGGGQERSYSAAVVVPRAAYTGEVAPQTDDEYMERLGHATGMHFGGDAWTDADLKHPAAIIAEVEKGLEGDRMRGRSTGVIFTSAKGDYIGTGERAIVYAPEAPSKSGKKKPPTPEPVFDPDATALGGVPVTGEEQPPDEGPATLPPGELSALGEQLTTAGFKVAKAKNAQGAATLRVRGRKRSFTLQVGRHGLVGAFMARDADRKSPDGTKLSKIVHAWNEGETLKRDWPTIGQKVRDELRKVNDLDLRARLAHQTHPDRYKYIAEPKTPRELVSRALIDKEVQNEAARRGVTLEAPTREVPKGGPGQRPEAPKRGGTAKGRHRPGAETRRAAEQERQQSEADILNQLVADAVAGGYDGDEATLRTELNARLQFIKDFDQEFETADRNPQVLLREIARYGGISLSKETGLKGEIKWLKENSGQGTKGAGLSSAANFRTGTVSGVPKVFNESGLSLDDMLTSLTQDGRFAHLESLNDLLQELRNAMSPSRAVEAAIQLRESLGEKWWTSIGTPKADVLDTGEEQPRLPEAGSVRDVEKETPEFEAPFSLESEADTTLREREGDLFSFTEREPGDEEPEFSNRQPLPPGFRRIAKHLTPAETSNMQMRADRARMVVALFDHLPPEVDIRSAAVAGQAARRWYHEAVDALRAIFGEQDAPRFALLAAALSPRQDVGDALNHALATWQGWVTAGRPTGDVRIRQILERAVGRGSVLQAWENNVVRALSAEDPHGVILSGPKVHSFFQNLVGVMDEVTLDSWMAAFALVSQELFEGELTPSGTAPGKQAGYRAMNAKVRAAAARLTATTGSVWTPAEVQAAVWAWTKTLYELATSTGLTAEQLVRQGGLSDDQIRAAPGIADLLRSNPTARAILRRAGYGPQLDAFDAVARPERAAVPSPDARAAARRQRGAAARRPDRSATLSLLRSAKRLDKLREARAKNVKLPATADLAPRFSERSERFTQDILPRTRQDLIDTLQRHPGYASFPQYRALMTRFNLAFAHEVTKSTVTRDLNAAPMPPSVRSPDDLVDIATGAVVGPAAPRTMTIQEAAAATRATELKATLHQEAALVRPSAPPTAEQTGHRRARTDNEKARRRYDQAKTIAEVVASVPTPATYAKERPAIRRGLVTDMRDTLERAFGMTDAPRFAALLAAFPPVEEHADLGLAARVWWAFHNAGEPQEPGAVERVLRRAQIFPKGPAPAWLAHVTVALQTDVPADLAVQHWPGPAFFKDVLNSYDDEAGTGTWIAAFDSVDQHVLGGKLTPARVVVGYKSLMKSAAVIAKRLTRETGVPWSTADVQRTIWAWARTVAELAQSTGTTGAEILASAHLSDAAITSAPGLAGLLTPDTTMRAILLAAGYGPQYDAINDTFGGRGRGAFHRPQQRGFLRARPRGEDRSATITQLREAALSAQTEDVEPEFSQRRPFTGEWERLPRLPKEAATAASTEKPAPKPGEPEQPDLPQFSQRGEPTPIFFSALTRAAESLPQAKGTPEQMAAMLTKAPGVKKEELDWTGVLPWLHDISVQEGRSVTRAEIVQYLQANELHVSETVLGETQDHLNWEQIAGVWIGIDQTGHWSPYVIEALPNGMFRLEAKDSGTVATVPTFDQAVMEAESKRRHKGDNVSRTKYEQHTATGGTDYRELLITLPPKPVPPLVYPEPLTELPAHFRLIHDANAPAQEWSVISAGQIHAAPWRGYRYSTKHDAIHFTIRLLNEEQNELAADAYRAATEGRQYTQGHFGHIAPNVVAHVRFKERTDAQGRRVLFIEELQSDWHQQGRRHGYGVEEASYRVPDAPFKTTWPELALKRMVRYAADHGFEVLAWTPGGQQNARYDLSKHVDEIRYKRNANGSYAVNVYKDGEHLSDLDREQITDAELENFVGKDITQRIVQGEGAAAPDSPTMWALRSRGPVTALIFHAPGDGTHAGGWYHRHADGIEMGVWGTREAAARARDQLQATLDEPPERVLRGAQLEVGGSGMKGFYDKILPTYLNKFGKPFGAKTSTVELSTGHRSGIDDRGLVAQDPDADLELYAVGENAIAQQYRLWSVDPNDEIGGNYVGPTFTTIGDAETWAENEYNTEVHLIPVNDRSLTHFPAHAIDITPPMREAALNSLPLFSRQLEPVTLPAGAPSGLVEAAAQQLALLQRTYADVPMRQIPGREAPVAVLDAGSRLTKAELKDIFASPAMQRLTVAVLRVLDEVLDQVIPEDVRANIERTGVLFNDGSFGVYLPKPRRTEYLRILMGRRATPLASIFLNFFEAVAGGEHPVDAAHEMYETAVHEAVHWFRKGHGTSFDEVYAQFITKLGPEYQDHAVARMMEAYGDPGNPTQIHPDIVRAFRVYSASRGRREVAPDAISRAARYSQRRPDERGGKNEPPGDARRDRERTVSHAELVRIAARRGTSVDEQAARAQQAGYTIHAAVIPGAAEFVEEDVLPALQHAATTFAHAGIQAQQTFAPATVGAGKQAAGALRAMMATEAQNNAQVERAAFQFQQQFDRLLRTPSGRDQAIAWWDAVQTGRPADVLPELRAAADYMRSVIRKDAADVLAASGKLEQPNENYFAQIWKFPKEDMAWIKRKLAGLMGKRPFEGKKSFLKQRTYPTFREGLDALLPKGIEPISYNPVDHFMLKHREMRRYIAARLAIQDFKAMGIWKAFGGTFGVKPDGWTRVEGPLGTIYGPPTVTMEEAFDPDLFNGLETFARALGVNVQRRVELGLPGVPRGAWGVAIGDKAIVTKAAGPETVLMHEIGHILDERYGLFNRIVKPAPRVTYTFTKGKRKGQTVTQAMKQDRATVKIRTLIKQELRALADLRYEGMRVSDHFKKYVRENEEKMANLVHAFIYNPERAKEVAPNAYWALFNTIKEHPELAPMRELQKTRSLKLGTRAHQIDLGGFPEIGYYAMPDDAARVFNNHLSRGLWGNSAIFDSYHWLSNTMVAGQLMASGLFHLTFTGIDALASQAGLGMQELVGAVEQRKPKLALRGVQRLARVGASGVIGGAAGYAVGGPLGILWAAGYPLAAAKAIKGWRAQRRWLTEDPAGRFFADHIRQMNEAGFRPTWDQFYDNGAMKNAIRALRSGNWPGALARLIPAAIDAVNYPIMHWWVPALKTASFLDSAAFELERLSTNVKAVESAESVLRMFPQNPKQIARMPREAQLAHRQYLRERADNLAVVRHALNRVQASMDNRFGEVVYDNWFWKRWLKDLAHIMLRSPGWQAGTYKGVGGGIGAQGVRLYKKARGQDVDESMLVGDMAWVLALIAISMLMGGMAHYLSTGERPEGRDWLYPKGPDGKRRTILTYLPRVISAALHPVRTAVGITNPLNTFLARTFVTNEKWTGEVVREPGDPFLKQAWDTLKFAAEEGYQPFVYSNIKRGQTAIESFMGVQEAAGEWQRSDAENYLHDIMPSNTRTHAEQQHIETRRDFREALKAGDTAAGTAAAAQLSRRSVMAQIKTAQLSDLQRAFRPTTLPQAIHAYELMTPDERLALRPELLKKWHGLFKNVPGPEKGALAAQFTKAMALPVAKVAAGQ